MYETSVGTIARSQRQLGTAQCEAELCRATCWNFQHDMKRTIPRVGLPLAAWIPRRGAAISWVVARSLSRWERCHSSGGRPPVLWGWSPLLAAPPLEAASRNKAFLPAFLLYSLINAPGHRAPGWAFYCLAQDADSKPRHAVRFAIARARRPPSPPPEGGNEGDTTPSLTYP